MPKISDLDYVSEIDATSYLLGVKGGSTVRFPASVLQGEAPVVNNTFIGQGDTPDSYTGQAGKMAAVNAAEDALEFTDAPTSLPTGGAAGQVLTKNSATDGDAGWADGGAETFLGLSDTPDSYAAYPGKVVAVKADGSGLEFASPSSGSYPIIDLSSATTDYALAPGEVAYVKYTSATSIPLHIALAEGEYSLTINGSSGVATSGSPATLSPNNTSYTGKFSRAQMYVGIGDTTVTAYTATAENLFIVASGLVLKAEAIISTKTTLKIVSVLNQFFDNSTNKYHGNRTLVWNDTATIWSSLGTITFPFAQSGIIIIKRIA